ncbi:hypothetical protein B0T21DRAFT_412726 [Apiosordaria backusii]|uniref:Uncharacterized protein n=1 Tax=Apiosordaria backusii TaxID=314023 RepID=A0AA40BE25_9PEZI|nr:hypothetical protein B0T21DRAFT_412726 [Apiosordaria backusii]
MSSHYEINKGLRDYFDLVSNTLKLIDQQPAHGPSAVDLAALREIIRCAEGSKVLENLISTETRIEATLKKLESEKKMLEESKIAFEKEKADLFEAEKQLVEMAQNQLGNTMMNATEKIQLDLNAVMEVVNQIKAATATSHDAAPSRVAELRLQNKYWESRLKLLEDLVRCEVFIQGFNQDLPNNLETTIFVMDCAAHNGDAMYRRFHEFRMTGKEFRPLCLYGVLEAGHKDENVDKQICLCPTDLWPYNQRESQDKCTLQIMPVVADNRRKLVFIFDGCVEGSVRRNRGEHSA